MNDSEPELLWSSLRAAGKSDTALRRVVSDPDFAARWVRELPAFSLRRLYDNNPEPVTFRGIPYLLPDFLQLRLERFLSKRICNRLETAVVFTFGDLLECSAGELEDIPQINVKSIDLIRKVLGEAGFELSGHLSFQLGFVDYSTRRVRLDRALAHEAWQWQSGTELTDVGFAYCDAGMVREALRRSLDFESLERSVAEAMSLMGRSDDLSPEDRLSKARSYVAALAGWFARTT